MPRTLLARAARRIRGAADPALADAADRHLLSRYLTDSDQAAFAELVRRHERGVLAACRQVLADPTDVEDAFQATFVVLVEQARRVRWGSSLGGWLYTVAHRVAVRAARTRASRARRETAPRPTPPAAAPGDALSWREAVAALHDELDRLPDRFRLPLILCYLDGLSRDEAAERLGWKPGSVKAGLERGRERLRASLERRGVTLSAGLFAAVGPVSVAPAADLVAAAVQAVGKPSAAVLRLARPTRGPTARAKLLLGPALAAGLCVGLLTAAPGEPPVAPEAAPPAAPAAPDPDAEWTYAVTFRGKPVAGAKVGLVPHTYPIPGEPKAGEPIFATTDEKGEARFRKPAGFASPSFARLQARDQTGRGGYGSIFGGNRYPPTIELLDNTTLTGRVTDADGKPVAGLKLAPVGLGPDTFARFGGRPTALADTPDWFWAAFPPAVAADGSFTLTGVPVEHSVAVRFTAPGYGSGRFWAVRGKAAPVVLRKAGAIALRFAGEPDARPGDIRVTATRTATADHLEATATATAKAGAAVTLPDLPPGEYQIGFAYDGPAPVFPKSVGAVTVAPGATAEVTTPLEPAARITARLVDSKTGKGVAGAKLSATVTRGTDDRVPITDAKADADGKIDLLVPAGMIQVVPMAADGYAVVKFSTNMFNPHVTEPVPVAAGKAHDFGAFSLVKRVELPGVVVDEAGKPVAGATVSTGYSQTGGGTGGASGADGTFTLKGADPQGGVFGVTARKGNAIAAAPVAVDAGKPDGEIRVVISEKFAARLRVRAVDRAGRPVEGVGVELAHSVAYLSRGAGGIGSGTARKVAATPANGRFESDVLQPGDRYGVTLSAPGYRTATTPEWVAVPGETHDYGDVTLTRADVTVSGTVRDAAGNPVAGATVFDNAGGPRPTATTTDAAGRFTLGGLYEGPGFLSVRADGFRLGSAPAAAGGPAVALTLRRLTDPPAPPPTVPDAHKAATAKLTRHLLTAMWANRVAADDDGKAVIRAMAKFDPPTARKWRDEEKARTGGKADLTAEIEAADRDRVLLAAAKADPDEAVALLKPAGGYEGFRDVCKLAGQLLPDAPDRALRVAEEAVARARGMPEADRGWALAQAGELVYRAGRKDAGRKLIEEAAKLVAGPDAEGYGRGVVACRLALFDPAAARAMIDPIRPATEFNGWLQKACPRLAETDLPRAKAWLADFRPDNSFARHIARQWVAYRIVRANTDEAVAVAEGIEDATIRAVTLAGLALRVKEKGRAVRLIDAAMDGILARPTGYYNGGAGGTAAVVLWRAKQVGHPDLAALRDKALAAHSPRPSGAFARGNGPDVQEAIALALTDPATARVLLARHLQPGDLTDRTNLNNRDPLLATALADPAALAPAIDALIAGAVKGKTGYQYTSLDTLAAALADPDRIAENVLRAARFFSDFEEE